jgi:creatinine amidohydrolase
MKNVLMAEMNWFEYNKALEEGDTVIVPVGSTEILGTHSPLGTDHLLAFELSKRLGEMTNCIVAPTIPVGDAIELSHWPSTITFRSHVLEELYRNICESFVSHGLKRIFFFNNHLSNIPAVAAVGRYLRRKGIMLAQVDWWRVAFLVLDDIIESKIHPKGHGGEVTTDVIMAVHPDLVDLSKATPESRKPPFDFHTKYTKYSIFTYPDFTEYCESGGWGDPAYSTKEKREKIIERALNIIDDFMKDFKSQSLPPPIDRGGDN